jgi:hypothetical protein
MRRFCCLFLVGWVVMGFVASCGSETNTGSAVLELQWTSSQQALGLRGQLSGVVTTIWVTVSAEGMKSIQASAPYEDYTMTIEGIPIGTGRSFYVEATDSGSNRIYDNINNIAAADINPGATTTVPITMSPADTYVDNYSPAAITDLAATISGADINLTWTATGDDASFGTATSYVLGWSTTTIQASDFDTPTIPKISGLSAPKASGQPETHVVLKSSLGSGCTFHFAIKATDDAAHTSDISNDAVVTITTCTNNDSCCPASCTLTNDNDCCAATSCSMSTDSCCPATCNAGNDFDCCAATSCSTITTNNCCPSSCTPANDFDCCAATSCSNIISNNCCPSLCTPADDFDCCAATSCNNISSDSCCPATCTVGNDVDCCAASTSCSITSNGCCPSGCTPCSDSDCTNTVCGDSCVSGSETCDNAIASGQPGACPAADCNDSIVCTTDSITSGSVANCNIVCSNVTITSCTNGDGCCPTAPNNPNGCTSITDSDCTCACNNGVVESACSELCDTAISYPDTGYCPTSCTPPDACHTSVLEGSNCTAHCVDTPILNCCITPADCADDGDVCTNATCVSNVCGVSPVANCCNIVADCADDGDVCTNATCVSNVCGVIPVANCCITPADCADDGDVCTNATCVSNVCGVSPVANCCNIVADCADDGDVCTNATCVGNVCGTAPVANCCNAPADCADDGDVCTDATCVGNVCGVSPVANCCNAPADCADDGDVCTDATCVSNVCGTTTITDCDDGTDGCCPVTCTNPPDTNCPL